MYNISIENQNIQKIPGLQDLIVNNKYRLLRLIANNSLNQIYLGELCTNPSREFTIKIELKKPNNDYLLYEYEIYQKLYKNHMENNIISNFGFPKIQDFQRTKYYNVLIMEMLGPTLEDLFGLCNKRFSFKTILMLAEQMIIRLKDLHLNHDLIHCHIKPEHFLMGLNYNCQKLYLIDYANTRILVSDQYFGTHKIINNNKYKSVNCLMNCQPNKRDDMISIGYILIYFLKGQLPWHKIHGNNKKQKLEKIIEMKLSNQLKTFCEGYPIEFYSYLKYCNDLEIDEMPKYTQWIHIFRRLFVNLNFSYDNRFDWALLTNEEVSRALDRIAKHKRTKEIQYPIQQKYEISRNVMSPKRKCLELSTDQNNSKIAKINVRLHAKVGEMNNLKAAASASVTLKSKRARNSSEDEN